MMRKRVALIIALAVGIACVLIAPALITTYDKSPNSPGVLQGLCNELDMSVNTPEGGCTTPAPNSTFWTWGWILGNRDHSVNVTYAKPAYRLNYFSVALDVAGSAGIVTLVYFGLTRKWRAGKS